MSNNKGFVWTDELVKEWSDHVRLIFNERNNYCGLHGNFDEDFYAWIRSKKISKQVPNKDKEYEILSVVSPINEEWTCDKNMFEWYMKNGWKINQVKRLSDNLIATVGGLIGSTMYTKDFIVEEIDVSTGECYLKAYGKLLPLRNAKLPKERIPLFTTEQIEEIILIVRKQLKIYDENK